MRAYCLALLSDALCPAKLVTDWLSSAACSPLACIGLGPLNVRRKRRILPFFRRNDFLRRISREPKVVVRCGFTTGLVVSLHWSSATASAAASTIMPSQRRQRRLLRTRKLCVCRVSKCIAYRRLREILPVELGHRAFISFTHLVSHLISSEPNRTYDFSLKECTVFFSVKVR